MKKFLTIALCALSMGLAIAQTAPKKYTVGGVVRDSVKRENISYATIFVRDTANRSVASTYSTDRGAFEVKVPKGQYKMIVGFTGYTPDTLTLKVEKDMTMDTVYLTEGIRIDAVQILGQLVTTDIDKTTYNLAADPETPALTGLEMMRKVPMLTVDGEDNIQLKGQSNFKILVNGKPSTMMTRNYKDVLKSMPANSIKSIEVITNPPAKYDAEGLGGLINIITVRKTNNGFNGSVNLGVDQWGGINGGGYIAAQMGKFALSANLYVGQYSSPETGSVGQRIDSLNFEKHFMNTTYKGSYRGTYGGLQLEASYEIDSVNLLTLALSGNLGSNKGFNDGSTEFLNVKGDPFSSYLMRSLSRSSYSSIGGNLDYQHTFKNPDETLTVSYKFEISPDNSYNETELYNPINYPDIYNRHSSNKTLGTEHTLQIDYFKPFTKKHQLEAGLKYLLRPSQSNTDNEILDPTGEWVPDNKLKNDMDYVQHIGSFYAGYALKLDKFSLKLGVRGEMTINDGTVKLATENLPIKNHYFNAVPYVTLNYKLNDAHSLRLGYTQRLNRPSIWSLNPYVNDVNPTQISSGNPNLESVLNHNINLSYSVYKQKWNLNFGVSTYLTDNSIEQLNTLLKPGDPLFPNHQGALYSRPENIGHREMYSANLGGSVRFFDGKLNISLNGSINYSVVDAPKAGLHNEGFNWNASANIYAQPWKGGGVSLYGGLYSPSISLQSRNVLYYYNGLSVSQSMLKKKLRVSLSCQSPFETKRTRSREYWGPGFSGYSESWRYDRNVRLSVQWNFGKMQAQVKKARRGISNDDGGGSKGGGGSAGASGGGQ
ncbi:MAG: TonB-dependent receptor [Mucinivorans sp.]